MTEPNQNVASTTDREVVSTRILDAPWVPVFRVEVQHEANAERRFPARRAYSSERTSNVQHRMQTKGTKSGPSRSEACKTKTLSKRPTLNSDMIQSRGNIFSVTFFT
jgi:hypothetical protein